MTTIIIPITGIKERCRMLSAFDARESLTPSGESNYNQMRLTEQEDILVDSFVCQAVNTIQASTTTIADMSFSDQNVVLSVPDHLAAVSAFKRTVAETITAYILTRWYEDKSEQRSNAYRALFQDMLETAKRIAYRKPAPTLC
jgi:hypothetical protein